MCTYVNDFFIIISFQSTYSSVTPEQWVSFSNENIVHSEKERNASSTLRGVINGVQEQTKQDILKQRGVVNLAFSKRIHETKEAKQQLEQHLDKVSVENDRVTIRQTSVGMA